jgi:hypothetical protein
MEEVVTKPRLLKDMKKVSPLPECQTSNVEAFHR